MGEEKGLALFRGKPLIRYSLDTLEQICDRILISANSQVDAYASFGYPVIADTYTNAGPMAGLSACLSQSTTRLNFVLTCDMPFVPPELLKYLLAKTDNYQAVIPVMNEFPEPLCGIYATNALWYVNDLIMHNIFRMTELLDRLNTLLVSITRDHPFYTEEMFANINTKQALKGGD